MPYADFFYEFVFRKRLLLYNIKRKSEKCTIMKKVYFMFSAIMVHTFLPFQYRLWRNRREDAWL